MKTPRLLLHSAIFVAVALVLSGCVSLKSTKLPDSWNAALKNPPQAAGDISGTYRATGLRCSPATPRDPYGGAKLEMVFFDRLEMNSSARVTLKLSAADELDVTIVEEAAPARSGRFSVSVDSASGAVLLERKTKSTSGETESMPHASVETTRAHLLKGRDGCLYIQITTTGVGGAMLGFVPVGGVYSKDMWMRFEPQPSTPRHEGYLLPREADPLQPMNTGGLGPSDGSAPVIPS